MAMCYEMQAQLTSYDGVLWKDQSRAAGRSLRSDSSGGGVAMADWDSDGDIDLAVGPPEYPRRLSSTTNPRRADGSSCVLWRSGRTFSRGRHIANDVVG